MYESCKDVAAQLQLRIRSDPGWQKSECYLK
jgi:hypothetical protein